MESTNNSSFQQQQVEEDASQPLFGGGMGGPPMMLNPQQSKPNSQNVGRRQNSRLNASQTSADPQDMGQEFRGAESNAQSAGNPFGQFPSQTPPLTQASIVKKVMKQIPKFNDGDQDRHSCREQLCDSLVREQASMNKERLLELDILIKKFNDQQQARLSKFNSNDGCSSGGTNPNQKVDGQTSLSVGGQLSPQSTAANIDSNNNKIALVVQLCLWVEEIIFDKFQDSKSPNYRTLVRRMSQTLRQKEEQKSTLLTCSDRDSVGNFVQEFMSQRSGNTPQRMSGGTGFMVQGAPSSIGNSVGQNTQQPGNAANAGGEATQNSTESNANNQERQQQSAQSNPFGGVKSPFGAPPMRGRGPFGRGRGGPRPGNRGGPGRGRAMQNRFVAPISNFPAPASSGSSMFSPPPQQTVDGPPQQNHDQNQQSIQNQQEPLAPQPTSLSIPNPSSQQQMIESGTDYDSSVPMTMSTSPPIAGDLQPCSEIQIKGNDQNNNSQRDENNSSPPFASMPKDSGSQDDREGQSTEMRQPAQQQQQQQNDQSLDFIDQLCQQQNLFGGGDSGAPNINLQGQTSNDQAPIEKKIEVGPSSGDYQAPELDSMMKDKMQSHTQSNDQQHHQTQRMDKEEISSVGITSFNNENEERPDFDRSSDPNTQPLNAQTQQFQQPVIPSSTSKNVPTVGHIQSNHQSKPEKSDNFQGQQNDQQIDSSQDIGEKQINQEMKFPNTNSNQGGQQSQFDQMNQVKQQNQSSLVEEMPPQNDNQNINSNQQEQFGNSESAIGGGQSMYMSPGETGSQQQNQSNSNNLQQQAISSTNAQPHEIDLQEQQMPPAALEKPNQNNQQNQDPERIVDQAKPMEGSTPQMQISTLNVHKLNLSLSSKPATSGRMTPPSNCSSARRKSQRIIVDKVGGEAGVGAGLGHNANGLDNEGTGSIQMSNDQSVGDIFMQQLQNQQKKINDQSQAYSTRNSMEPTMSVPMNQNNDPNTMTAPYRGFQALNTSNPQVFFATTPKAQELFADEKEYQSEANAKVIAKTSKHSERSGQQLKSSKASSRNKKKDKIFFNPTHGYIPHPLHQQSIIAPSENMGTASVASIPVTTFEDTQKMLQAYKKKKREIMKMKDHYFKLEQEFMAVKQRSTLREEELSATQKKLGRVEKQLKQNQLKEHINDDSIAQRQLQLKSQEQEILQNELKHQKSENQKLREKVRELLKKCSQAQLQSTSSADSDATRTTQISEQDLKVLEQQHQLELVRQREQKNLEIRQLQDDLNFTKTQNEKLKAESQTNQSSLASLENMKASEKSNFERQLKEVEEDKQREVESLKSQNDTLTSRLNEQTYKRASRPSSATVSEMEQKHKTATANYETIIRDLKDKLQQSQQQNQQDRQQLIEEKDSMFEQAENERNLMQIQIDNSEQQIYQLKVLLDEVTEQAETYRQSDAELRAKLGTSSSSNMGRALTPISQIDGQVAQQNSDDNQMMLGRQRIGSASSNERDADQAQKPITRSGQANMVQDNTYEQIEEHASIGETTGPVSMSSHPQTAQGLFDSPRASQKQDQNSNVNQAISSFDQSDAGAAQSTTGGPNVMIVSGYFGDSSKQSGASPDQFFNTLSQQSTQPQQNPTPQSMHQERPPAKMPRRDENCYDFSLDDARLAAAQPEILQPPPAQVRAQIPAQQPVYQAAAQMPEQAPTYQPKEEAKVYQPPKKSQNKEKAAQITYEANPYDFMMDDEDEDAGAQPADEPQPNGGGGVIPNSMFD